jgi:MFS family permease
MRPRPRLRLPAVLREEPQFARLFAGQATSILGDRITFVALPFAVLSIGGSAADVGLVIATATIPFALFSLVGGVWADRLPRHRLMLASDAVRLVTQALAAVLLLSDAAHVWHLAVLMGVFGTAEAFFSPAVTGLIPLVVRPERLQEANAQRGFTYSTVMVAGPAVAGVLIAATGPGLAIAVDAGTFAVSVWFLARLAPPTRAAVDHGEDAEPGFLAQLHDGFREVRSRAWVWSFLVAMTTYHVVVLPSVFVLGPVLAERELDGASSWAIVTVAFGLGSIAGDLLALRLKPSRPLAVAAGGLILASCQALIIGSGAPVGVIAALEGVAGVGVSLFFTLWETALQAHIPERAISRVSSYDYMVSAGLMPVGLALAGPVSEAIGLHATLYAMSAIGVPVAFWLLSLPAVRRLPAHPAVAPGTA